MRFGYFGVADVKKRFSFIVTIISVIMCAVVLCGCTENKPPKFYFASGSNFSAPTVVEHGSSSSENSSETIFESSEDVPSNSDNKPESESSGDGSVYDEKIYYALRTKEKKFADESLFVGDSICKGLAVYNIVNANTVLAGAGVATRNFFKTKFYYYGKSREFSEVLGESKPKQVLFSMGMNDVNMISSEQFCKNYSEIISFVLENSDADVFVCAITPICSSFTPDGRIDEFNAAAKAYITEKFEERVHFVDFTEPLKNKEGRLKSYFSGGDGVHISPAAYYAAFHELYAIISATDYFEKQDAESSENSSSQDSEQSSTQDSEQSSTQDSEESSVQSSSESSVQSSTESSVQSSVSSSAQSSAESSVQSSVPSSAQSSTESSVQSSIQSSAQSSAESSVPGSAQSSGQNNEAPPL